MQKCEDQTGRKPVVTVKEEENVWKNDNFILSSFDIPNYSKSWKAFPKAEIIKRLQNNISTVIIYEEDQLSFIRNVAVCLKGHHYVINNHALPKHEKVIIDLLQTTNAQGVNSNMRVTISQKQIVRFPERDLAFFQIDNVPPKKDITKLFIPHILKTVFKGYYVSRDIDGVCSSNDMSNVRYIGCAPNEILKSMAHSYAGISQIKTMKGFCGSLLVLDTEYGPLLSGIHYLGSKYDNTAVSTIITQTYLEEYFQRVKLPVVQCGTPTLSAPSAQRNYGELHHKSTVRFMDKGTCNTYGSFSGFKTRHVSKVTKTLFCDDLEKRGYALKHGAPVMKGWQPWRIAALDMVNPVNMIDKDILNTCKKSYLRDILNHLPQEAFEEIFVYDDFTSVNGYAGLKYVDAVPRGTSAGNPWKQSKRAFLNTVPGDVQAPDAVMPNDEIMQRVRDIEKRYIDGERCMPNFCAHLKDEPIKFAKIEEGKTRVFTGAPFDWSLVVRKYLLSCVRCMQKHKYVFECAPGTNCQSTEWNDMYRYLTHFSTERIVAGDYKAYDKRMPPSIILAAFEILFDICKRSGYTDDELKVVWGIAEDTAFPLIDFNGDLIEFYGSNPSGHPLTVIINSLANSLYMRYAYYVTNPKKECYTFKENVKLMTYGDDNIMNVSKHIDFFHHTSIQQSLKDIGITYTMADKEAESVPFINIENANFLKRQWKFEASMGVMLCPLEMDSILKSLMITVKSKSIPFEAQCMAIVSSAMNEAFYHGKDTFFKFDALLKEIVSENNLSSWVEEHTFPTWHEIESRFWKNSKKSA